MWYMYKAIRRLNSQEHEFYKKTKQKKTNKYYQLKRTACLNQQRWYLFWIYTFQQFYTYHNHLGKACGKSMNTRFIT